MARTIVCPHCQMKGNLPESAKASRIRCPKCGQSFNPASSGLPATDTSKVAKKKTSSSAVPGQSPLAIATAVSAEPVVARPEPIATNGSWRPTGNTQSRKKANPVVLFALTGLSILALLMLVVMVMVFLEDERERLLAEAERREQKYETIVSRANELTSPVEEAFPTNPHRTEPAETKPLIASVAKPSSTPKPVVQDPQEIARKLKDATVLVKNKVNGKTLSSGTGFVIESEGDTVWVATNRHVAVLDMSEVPESIAPAGTRPELEAVFRSGEGSKREQALPAVITAADFTDELNTELAFLEVKGVREAPAPLSVENRMKPSEGEHYLGAGFPSLGMVGTATGGTQPNPLVRLLSGRVASFRRDDSGEISLIEVDGSLQPGDSGGPIIDEKTGKLLGITMAKSGSLDRVGLVVPAEELWRSLNGRVGSVALTLQESPKGTADLQVKAQVVDPKGRIKGVAVHIVPAGSNPTPVPNPDGSWAPVTKAKEVELTHDAVNAIATGSLKVALNGDGPDSRRVLVQTAVRDSKGRLVFGRPRNVLLPEKPGRIQPPGQLDRILRAASRNGVNLLGPLLDNSRDCILTKDEATLKIRIDLPGKLYTLAPELANNRNIPLHNAPITLMEVEGDFAASVDVNAAIDPGTNAPKDPKGRKIPFTVQSQGLILYEDKDNFLRLERAQTVFPKTLTASTRLMIEFVQKGRHAIKPIYRDVPDQKTMLVLLKRKGRIRCLFSQDQGKTLAPFEEFAAELPERIQVGLTASNISTKPFSAEFDNFAILNDATKLDQEFGD